MKLFAMLCWSNKDAKEMTIRFKKWEGKGDYKVLFPTSTMIGRNLAFMVAEADDIAEIQKDV